MAIEDSLLKGFSLGQQTSRWKPLGDAIRGTLSRLQEQQDFTGQMVTKAGIENMFRAPEAYKPKTREEALDFERAKAGIISPSDELEREKTGLEISKLKQEQGLKEQKNQRETDLIRETAQSNLQTVQKIKEGKKYFGRLGNLPTIATPNVFNDKEYGERKQWENEINKLLSQKVVDLITTMKSASQTGATGFGQLSEKEGQLLREASTALSKDLPPNKAVYYLNQLEGVYKKILSSNRNIFNKNNNMNDLENTPSGVDPNDWNSATPEQKQELLDFLNRR